jgi:hypothetical protein
MQTSRDRIAAPAKLPTGVQGGQNHLYSGALFHGVIINRNPTPVIGHPDAPIFSNDHIDLITMPGESLVN